MKWIPLVLLLILLVSGCAFWDGFTRGVSGGGGEKLLDTAGEVTGNVVRESVPLIPSPWREIVVGCLAGITGWVASARKMKGMVNISNS